MNKRPRENLDKDLDVLSHGQLIAEIKRLRKGIREHRDSDRHALCWYHPKLWGLLPERTEPLPTVPTWHKFLEGCVRFRASLDSQAAAAPRTTEAYQGRKK